jgi:DnaJ family protein C protein 7
MGSRYIEASVLYTKAIEADMDNGVYSAKSYSNRSNVFCKFGKYEEAIKDCDTALDLLQSIGQDEEMANSKHRVLFQKLYMRKGECFLKLELFEDAVRFFETADSIKSDQQTQRSLSEAQAKLQLGRRKDYYKILGVSRYAGDAEIKKAYKKMALKFHPDKVAKAGKEIADGKFKKIVEAYTILMDPQEKRKYDREKSL